MKLIVKYLVQSEHKCSVKHQIQKLAIGVTIFHSRDYIALGGVEAR